MGGVTEIEVENFKRFVHLFDAYDFDRALIGGVFEQHQMGRIFCDDVDEPQCAVMFHPGDYAYLTGDPKAVDIQCLIEQIPCDMGVPVGDYEIFCPRNTVWIAALNAIFGDRLGRDGYEYFTFTDAKRAWIQRWKIACQVGFK